LSFWLKSGIGASLLFCAGLLTRISGCAQTISWARKVITRIDDMILTAKGNLRWRISGKTSSVFIIPVLFLFF
jgi:hypothetical protein